MEQVEEYIYIALAFKRKHAEGTISEKGNSKSKDKEEGE